MNKYTLRPWYIGTSNILKSGEIGIFDGPAPARLIATIHPIGRNPLEAAGNAFIMRASVDMYEAIKKALDGCVDLIGTEEGNALDAAIAKAEGRE